MLYEVMRAYPDLGSFLYGHCKDIDLSATGFIVLCCVLLALLALLLIGGVVGYVLQSVALCKIAKRYGAGKKLRTKACLPFVRYFAIGKMAERCDVVSGAQKRRLWGRILVIVCSIAVPITAVLLILAWIGLPGIQLLSILAESADSITRDVDGVLAVVLSVLYVLLLLPGIPLMLLQIFSSDLYATLYVLLPFIGLVCLIVGTLLVAAIRALSGVCYYKILRGYFVSKSALLLTIGGAVTGWMPVVLFIASRKRAE